VDKLTSPASGELDHNHLSATALSQPRRMRGFQIPVSERRLLLVVGDLVAIEFSVLIALALWALRAQYRYDIGFLLSQFGWFIVLPVLWLVLALVNDYYDLRVAAQVGLSLRRLALIECEVLAIYTAKFFLSTPGTLPRRFMVYYAIISLVLIGLWRAARIFLIGWTGFQRRALVVGNGHEAEVIWQALKHEAAGDYQLVGVCASERDAGFTRALSPAAAHLQQRRAPQ
jgi:FlaA1/EpsC-like NDP-sugar epimerase